MSNKFLTTAEQIESLSYLNSIDFFARQIVDGFISGIHKSPYHGFSVEFAEHRVYNQGESVRHIDWNFLAEPIALSKTTRLKPICVARL